MKFEIVLQRHSERYVKQRKSACQWRQKNVNKKASQEKKTCTQGVKSNTQYYGRRTKKRLGMVWVRKKRSINHCLQDWEKLLSRKQKKTKTVTNENQVEGVYVDKKEENTLRVKRGKKSLKFHMNKGDAFSDLEEKHNCVGPVTKEDSIFTGIKTSKKHPESKLYTGEYISKIGYTGSCMNITTLKSQSF